MKIRDIVNRDLVNLTNCEQEPIHIPGSIQPHGFLLAFKKTDRRIDFCSGNVITFAGLRHDQVLSRRLAEIFGEEQEQQIHRYIAQLAIAFSSPLRLQLNNQVFSTNIHASGAHYIMEFEPANDVAFDPSIYYNQTRQFVSYMERSSSLQALCQGVADETRAITGYDRVMIYRFDKDYNGEVFAESVRDDLEPFFGLHYPHTDIPAQARELYKQNLLRLIVDVSYTPVPLYTIDDVPEKNLNLGNAILRSVSPIHIQYLHNIGVTATMTISLIHAEKLWGLIACHHYCEPKHLNAFTRISAQLQGHFLTSQINVRQVEEDHVLSVSVGVALKKMLTLNHPIERAMFEFIAKQEELLDLCNADGVAIFLEDKLFTNGTAPSHDHVRDIVTAMRLESTEKVIHSSKLIEIYPPAEALRGSAAGALLHALDDVLNMGIIWFRKETLQEVKWAGDPEKAIIKDEKGLSPRKSFDLWKQEIKFQSNEWKESERNATSAFAKSLDKQAHLLFLGEEEAKYRILSEQLKETNAELENMNWISTHDLKEPLRKIQVFASRILERNSEDLSPSISDSLKRIHGSANRMQMLIRDILTYSRIRYSQEATRQVDLTALVKSVLKDLDDDISEKGGSIVVEDLPMISGVPFLLTQLFANLLRNSIKFARKNVPPAVSITSNLVVNPSPMLIGKFAEIVLHDNGIGIPEEHSESVFRVFTRLHATSEYEGSGIGLALCRKIMQNHGGAITIQKGTPEGTSFLLYFPIL